MAGLFLAGAATSVGAVDTPKADTEADRKGDITVIGERPPSRETTQKQARAVSDVGDQYRTPLARFQMPVCPGIAGLSVDLAEIMVSRIRSNVESLGLKLSKEGHCDPNLLVAFVKNGQETLRGIVSRKPDMFDSIEHDELRELLADSGPVHAWVSTEVRSKQGDTVGGTTISELVNFPVLNVTGSQSHMYLAHRVDIGQSVVMIDLSAADGMSVVQLADYATMRGLAKTRPPRAQDGAGEQTGSISILSLFDGAESHPFELTDFDRAYLRMLYEGLPNLSAANKFGSLPTLLRDEKEKGLARKPDKAAEATP